MYSTTFTVLGSGKLEIGLHEDEETAVTSPWSDPVDKQRKLVVLWAVCPTRTDRQILPWNDDETVVIVPFRLDNEEGEMQILLHIEVVFQKFFIVSFELKQGSQFMT